MKVSTEIPNLDRSQGPDPAQPVKIESDNDTPRGCVVLRVGEAMAIVRASELTSAAQKARK